MPGKRRYKDAFSATSVSSKRSRYMSSSKLALSRAIRAALPEEVKYYDNSSTVGTPVSLAANTLGVQPLTFVGLGTGDAERIGRRVSAKYVEIRFSLYQAASQTNANIRLFCVMDTQNNGTTPTVTEVLEFAGVLAQPNSVNKQRFKFLWDECFQVNNTNSNTDYALQTKYIDIAKALKRTYSRASDRFIQYNGDTAGVAATNGKNACFFFWISDVTITGSMGTGTSRAGLDYSTRFAYTDA